MLDLLESSITKLRSLLDSKKVSAVELARMYLKRIHETNSKLNSFITLDEEKTLEQAHLADRMISENAGHVLTGIPVALKDVILAKGWKTTAGSKFLSNFQSPFDSTVAKKLREQGAVFLGKNNCDEFAMGSSNENSAYGPVRNPWNLDFVPGGSSGGSAACVAGFQAVGALGTDTGGSIRQPAALTGIVGLKPTYGRVSRYGIVAFASSLDQVGPMARTVEDTAILFDAIVGPDRRDSTCAHLPLPYVQQSLLKRPEKLRIGIPKEFFPKELSSVVLDNFDTCKRELEKLGHSCIEISLPHTEYAISCYYVIAPAEASANLARYDGVRFTNRSSRANDLDELFTSSRTEGFGEEVRRRIILGTFVLSSGYYDAYFRKAQKVRRLIQNDFTKAFESVDAILAPTSPFPAFRIGEKKTDPMEMYLSDIFTVSISLAGLPAISVPSGLTQDELPLGVQVIGKPFEEGLLLKIAQQIESFTDFQSKRPKI